MLRRGTQARACGPIAVGVGAGEEAKQSSVRHASSAESCNTNGLHCMPGDRVDPAGRRRSCACEMVRGLRAIGQSGSDAGGADGKAPAVLGAVYLVVLRCMQ